MLNRSRYYLRKIKDALKHERDNPPVARTRNEREFLPAALEILESPPSPFSRILALIICLILVAFVLLTWLCFIDTESVAEGKLVPIGEVKTIQSQINGRVRSIHVAEDDQVQRDQLLIKLDPTEQEVDLQQVQINLLDALLNITRIRLLIQAIDSQQAEAPGLQRYHIFQADTEQLIARDSVNEQRLHVQQQRLQHEFQHYVSTDAALKESETQQLASIQAIQAEIHRLSELAPLHTQHEQSIRQLYKKGHLSRLEWLAAKEKQVDSSQALLVQKNRLQEARAGLAAVSKDRVRQQQAFRREWMEALTENTLKKDTAQLTLLKAQEWDLRTNIRSPVDGTVYQLKIHTEGAVVQPAEFLMLLIPTGAELEVEAMLPNKDIGFVKEGMRADIKLESFPFTYYGYLTGTVRQVSVSAVERDGMEPYYPIRISLDQQGIYADNLWRELQAGMTATAEVKTGYRRLLAFFMSPLMRYQDEALRVR